MRRGMRFLGRHQGLVANGGFARSADSRELVKLTGRSAVALAGPQFKRRTSSSKETSQKAQGYYGAFSVQWLAHPVARPEYIVVLEGSLPS